MPSYALELTPYLQSMNGTEADDAFVIRTASGRLLSISEDASNLELVDSSICFTSLGETDTTTAVAHQSTASGGLSYQECPESTLWSITKLDNTFLVVRGFLYT